MPLSARNSCLARVWHSCDVLLLFFVCVLSVGDRVWWWCLCRERGRIGVFFPPQSVQDTRAERRYLDMATFHTIVPSFRNNGHRLRSRRHERSVSLHNFRLEESVQVFVLFCEPCDEKLQTTGTHMRAQRTRVRRVYGSIRYLHIVLVARSGR